MAVDQIHRGIDSTIRPRLDHPEIAAAIQHGDIHKILKSLPAGVTRADIEDYLKQRMLVFQQGLIQNVQIKADEASLPPPDATKHLLPMDAANTLTDDDRDLLAEFFGGSAKAATAVKAAPPPPNDGEASASGSAQAQQESQAFGQELVQTVDARMKQRDEFLFELEQAAFDLHLTQELRSREHELREELRRIFRLVKEKKIAPEFAIVALTRVEVMKAGLIVALEGKMVKNINEQQVRVTESIRDLDAGNVGEFEMKKLKANELGRSMSEVMQNIQMAMQKVSTAESTGKSMIDEYNRTKQELIRKVDAKG